MIRNAFSFTSKPGHQRHSQFGIGHRFTPLIMMITILICEVNVCPCIAYKSRFASKKKGGRLRGPR
jgi:hypothetical protein